MRSRNTFVDNKITIETLLKLPVDDSEQLLINYIERLKSQDVSHSSINLLFCVVKHFCVMNNIRINDRKIAKFLGESGRKNTDRGYNHAEIKKLLDVSDLHMKMCNIVNGFQWYASRTSNKSQVKTPSRNTKRKDFQNNGI